MVVWESSSVDVEGGTAFPGGCKGGAGLDGGVSLLYILNRQK